MFPYLKDGFSIDETKVSVFIITFVITFGLIIYSFFVFGDIPPNLLNFAIGLITAITGINVVAKAVQLKQNQTVNQIMETTEEIMNSSTNISEK
jgi:cytochrome c biogenesis protein CcdA